MAEPAKTPNGKARRDRRVVDAFKASAMAARPGRCASCGWRPPRALLAMPEVTAGRLLHAHHVWPICYGGPDEADNLVLLCPTHHAMAHALGTMSRAFGRETWTGPKSREHLLHELTLIRNPRAWAAWLAMGRDWERHLRDEAIRSERRFSVVRGGAS